MCTLASVTNYKTNTELMGLSSIESFWEFLSVCSSYKEIQATDAVRSVLDILNRLGTLLEKAIEKPEKNVNLLEILWADENANSRILGALFERKTKGDMKYYNRLLIHFSQIVLLLKLKNQNSLTNFIGLICL